MIGYKLPNKTKSATVVEPKKNSPTKQALLYVMNRTLTNYENGFRKIVLPQPKYWRVETVISNRM
jgi:hypothetical protein